jgi:prepilin-type processing-associated H-X9-DG protein
VTPVDERYQARAIDVARDRGVTITFYDGHVAHFDLVTLRRNCPCATCRGLRDRGEDAWPRPGSPSPLAIDDASLHGAWGLVITWNDGHATGIFPFESLRRWSDGDRRLAFGPDSGLGGAGT